MAHTLPSNPFGTVWRFILRTRQSGKRSAPARHSWHLRALAASILACMAIFGYSAQAEAQTVPTASEGHREESVHVLRQRASRR